MERVVKKSDGSKPPARGSRFGGPKRRDFTRRPTDARGEGGAHRFGGAEYSGGRPFRKKQCRFCAAKAPGFDYKDTELLQRFITEKGKIVPRRITGTCSKHQRHLAVTVKRSRHSGLLAFQAE